MTLDPKTHRIYLSAATAATAEGKAEAKRAPAGKGAGRRRIDELTINTKAKQNSTDRLTETSISYLCSSVFICG
jgi:hypothetical protein